MVQARRLMLLFLALFLAAFANQISAADELPTLRISLSPVMGSVALAFAEGWGLFEKHGLNVELVGLSDDEERSAALMTGDIDGMVCGVTTAILLFTSGTDVLITSAAYQREQSSSLAILSPRSFNIESLDALLTDKKGAKKIAVLYRSDFEYQTDRLLESLGYERYQGSPYVPFSDMLTVAYCFAGQMLAAAVLPEPYITYIANLPMPGQGKPLDLIHLADFEESELLPSVIVFRGPVVEEHSELIDGFYQAYREVVATISNSDREDLLAMGIDKALALFFPGTTEESIPEGVLDSFVFPRFSLPAPLAQEQFEDVVSWLISKHYTRKNPSYEEMSTDRFLQ